MRKRDRQEREKRRRRIRRLKLTEDESYNFKGEDTSADDVNLFEDKDRVKEKTWEEMKNLRQEEMQYKIRQPDWVTA
jgi:hypothetical protein